MSEQRVVITSDTGEIVYDGLAPRRQGLLRRLWREVLAWCFDIDHLDTENRRLIVVGTKWVVPYMRAHIEKQGSPHLVLYRKRY